MNIFLALNEVAVKPASPDRMITSILEMEIDGEVVDQYLGGWSADQHSYWVDGLHGRCGGADYSSRHGCDCDHAHLPPEPI